MNEVAVHKKKQLRSPSYPAVDLATAIAKAKVIYEHDRRSAVPVAVAARHWGTNIKSSTGLRLISAVIQYGLVVEEGSGEDRHLRLSEQALDILLAESDTSRERRIAIQAAALAPKIHKLLWGQYGGNLPSDETIKTFLIRKMEFHDTHVQSFITQFRATIEFAGLSSGDECLLQNSDEANESTIDDPPLREVENGESVISSHNPSPSPPPTGSGPHIVFPLSGGNVVEIRLKKKVSLKDFERIRQLLELSEGSLVDDQDTVVTDSSRIPR